jgi:phosphoglycerate dehydrogenase-like enzyme
MLRALITAVPFGEVDSSSLDVLHAAGVSFDLNPLGRRLTGEELASLITGYDVLIAGTEPITGLAIESADRLRLISRVGVGLDSVDLSAARRRGIPVAYTPEAPADAVAELTIGVAAWSPRGRRGRYVHARAVRWGACRPRYLPDHAPHGVDGRRLPSPHGNGCGAECGRLSAWRTA